LEARRTQLYEEIPVPKGWHEAYAISKADTLAFQAYADLCTQKKSYLQRRIKVKLYRIS
jgi:hypothetical protein